MNRLNQNCNTQKRTIMIYPAHIKSYYKTLSFTLLKKF